MNDGTAMVIFAISVDLVAGKEITKMEMGVKFLRLSLCGPLLGFGFAAIMVWWLGRIHNKSVLETNLTVTFAYMTYYTAERPEVHVSGILAIVCLGIYMAKQGKTNISSESEHAVHNVWQTIGFSAETVIFSLSGLTIGIRALEVMSWAIIGKTTVLYVLLHLIRFGLLLAFRPLMNCSGYPITVKHCVLLTWGALRGALGIFLALIVVGNHKIKEASPECGNLILFYSSAIAVMTLVINGTTTGILVEFLGMSKETPTRKKFMYMFAQRVKAFSVNR